MAKEIVRPAAFPFYDYAKYTFSLAVKKGNLLFLAGHTASKYDPSANRIVCKGGIAEQVRVSYEKFKVILEAAGADFSDVVRTMDYITPAGRENYRATADVRHECFRGSFPASTGVVVNRLLRPDALLEVDAIAVLGGERREIMIPQWPRYEGLTYRPAVNKGDLLFLSGQASVDQASGKVVGEGDLVAQTRQAYQNIAVILEAAGASFADVVKTTDYIVPAALGDYRATADVRREFFKGCFPASTGIVVSQLLGKDLLIEVDVVAVLGGERREIAMPQWRRYEGLTFHPAVKKGNLLFVSGQPGVDQTTGQVVGDGDVVAQMRQAYQNIAVILEAAGASFADVVKTTDYIVPAGLENYRATADVRREYFGEEFPASTGIVVEQLVRKEFLVEVDVIAVLD